MVPVALEARRSKRGTYAPVAGELQLGLNRVGRQRHTRRELQRPGEHPGRQCPSGAFELASNPVVQPDDVGGQRDHTRHAESDEHPLETAGTPRFPARSGSGSLSAAGGRAGWMSCHCTGPGENSAKDYESASKSSRSYLDIFYISLFVYWLFCGMFHNSERSGQACRTKFEWRLPRTRPVACSGARTGEEMRPPRRIPALHCATPGSTTQAKGRPQPGPNGARRNPSSWDRSRPPRCRPSQFEGLTNSRFRRAIRDPPGDRHRDGPPAPGAEGAPRAHVRASEPVRGQSPNPRP